MIQKSIPFGFFVQEPSKEIDIKHETATAKNKKSQKISKKGAKSGGFLNRYDFAYDGRDTVNQLGKVAPSIIKNASSEISNIALQRTNQIVRKGGEGEKIKRVLPNILRRAIEYAYQTPFCLLGKFGRQQLQKLKKQNITLDNIYN